MEKRFEKKYTVAIDTVPFPEDQAERIELVMKSFGPILLKMIRDAISVAIGTWPTPEKQ